MLAVVNLTQIAKIKLITHAIDPGAFMIIISANEVMGPGFTLPGVRVRNQYDEEEKSGEKSKGEAP